MLSEVLHVQACFDYAALPSEVAVKARSAAERVKLRLKRSAEDIIEIGRELTEVKAELPHGQFLPWIAAEFEMGNDTAQNFMRVYVKFGQKPNYSVFQPTVLYALSAPSTPDEVIEKAISKAETGEKVTVADVKDWKAELESAYKERDKERQRSMDWRDQALAEKKKREAAESAAALKSAELSTLQKSVEQSAKRMAAAQLSEVKASLDLAMVDKAELEQKIKAMRKAQDAEVEKRTKQAIHAQQDDITRKESQLRHLEGRIEEIRAKLKALDEQDRVVMHYQDSIKKIGQAMNALSLELMEAFDPDYSAFLPAQFVADFQKIERELSDGAAGIRKLLGHVEVRKLEVAIND